MHRIFFVLAAVLLLQRCPAADYPPVPSWQPDPAQREHLRRALTLLGASKADERRTVKVLFYGQSITQQAWWREVERYLRKTYPHADLVVENRAIGGHSSQLLVKTAEADLYPFQPDLLVFHVYGSHIDYESIIRRVRERTCADILLATDHVTRDEALTEETDPAKLTPQKWDAWMNHAFLPGIAAKYKACRADVHQIWKSYLATNKLEAKALLRDSVHLNSHGEWLMAEILKKYLEPLAPDPGYNPYDEARVRTVPVSLLGDAKSWVSEFRGGRVDLLFKPEATAPVHVRVDGKPPSGISELMGFTRVSAFPDSDWPILLKVGSQTPLVAEDWYLNIHESADDGSVCRFTLRGSVTGEEGGGWSTNRFVSPSGRVIIEPEDWNLAYCVKVFKRKIPEGHVASFKSALRGQDIAQPPSMGGDFTVTVAHGLPSRPHRVELSGAQLINSLRGVRIYSPPLFGK